MPDAKSPTARPMVLLVDDDRQFLETARPLLEEVFEVHIVPGGEAALAEFRARAYDVVLLDVDRPGETDGLEILRRFRQIDSQVPVILVARIDQPGVALRAGQLGALDYYVKGGPLDALTGRIRAAIEHLTAERQREAADREPGGMARWQFVGESDAVRRLLEDTMTVAEVESPVLVTGEHGTGKEVLARYIHRIGPRADKPFVAVNCAAIPESLFESELFGHERGAFTGAVGTHRGSFELAEDGTLLLDEITEMPARLQPKLLRALQSGEFRRIGSERLRRAKARVICSSNRDPLQAVRDGRLRQDLYYRINVIHLHIPPLRDRRTDVPILAHHFLRAKSQELGKHVEGISPGAEALLLAHDWPGNARELENLIERAVVFCRDPQIGPELLSPISEGAPFLALPWEEARDLAMRRFERSYLTALLQVYSGSVAQAARAMNVSRQAFYKALERAELNAEDFRPTPRRR